MTSLGSVISKTLVDGGSINTLGTSPVTVIAADPNRRYLSIHNPNDTAKIAIAIPGQTAAINGAGAITLLPYGTFWAESNFDPTCAFTAVASAGSSSITIWVG